MLWLRPWYICPNIFMVNTQWGGVFVCCYALSWKICRRFGSAFFFPPVQLLISCSISTLFSSIFAVIVWAGNYGCSPIWGLQFLSLFVLVFRVEEWTEAQIDICTSILFVWQVSSITVTIEYNILTSSRRVANRLIIVEDFCCVYCFVRESNSPTDGQVISCSYVCYDIYR